MKLIIQIPCYNEEKTLPEVIADLPRQVDQVDTIEYLVIDDGSTDRTVEVARQLGVHHVLSMGSNCGLATAFLAGMRYCLELGADIIVNTDGDNQYQGGCIPELIKPVVTGELDIVVGARPIDEIAHFSWLKKKLQRLGSRMVRQFSGTDITDTTSGFRAYSAEAAMRLDVFNRYTYTLETIIQAGHMNMRIGHVHIKVNPKTRESRLISSIPHYIWRSGTIIIRSYVTYKPLRTFLYLAMFPGLTGIFLYFRWLFMGAAGRYPSLILASALITIGALLMMLGILSDIISANRRLIQEDIYLQRKQMYTLTNSKEK